MQWILHSRRKRREKKKKTVCTTEEHTTTEYAQISNEIIPVKNGTNNDINKLDYGPVHTSGGPGVVACMG